ncbi:iron-sulfur cluster-binding protein, putative [Citrifermentans bemidjiense Bem]|uniref:Iron-sulfur cluster-binding protein, putative n=1 Tax=Citrifermentans bemidjiense (strain ATCC BAA-1014 / DSM 16622 / JCM 12645 / Bem) TaxID=404380 RepID=B5E7T3_CITBB|nr:2Fe-2S iron-sulfur cluster-binding protein [Citrifermentans bemidjiense]ACH38469.1 iron-sulfur cluster-binding protein, putative [Citrifermentans bemidjiense Bem]
MSEIVLQIDGKEVKAQEGMTIVEAANTVGIHIPTLCHHEKLEPYGACRICTVEAESNGRKTLVAGCLYPVENGMVVQTSTEKLYAIRKVLVEQMMAHAPDAPQLIELAKEYGADKDRFDKDPSFCILCGLCVRYCAEVKKKNAIGYMDRGPRREISFIPEVAAKECWDCKECFPLCPTSALQAAYVLTEALLPAQPEEEGGCSCSASGCCGG